MIRAIISEPCKEVAAPSEKSEFIFFSEEQRFPTGNHDFSEGIATSLQGSDMIAQIIQDNLTASL